MKNQNVSFVVKSALVAALYVALTLGLSFLSYQAIQFRVSEVMVLLAFVDRRYSYGLLAGCFIANLLGPFGLVDAIFGTIASAFVFVMIYITRRSLGNNTKSLLISSLWASVSALIIAFEIVFFFKASESFWFWTAMVAIGQFTVVTLGGFPIFRWIIGRPDLMAKLSFDRVITPER
ncbi:MAG: QueT transporter family protein [Bacillota bacterium]|nr:QueT transporter family protein [Bacillota bacterium]